MTVDKLKKYAGYSEFSGPVVLVIMDGVGIGPGDESDGVHMANTPVLDRLFQEKLFTRLKAHGSAVGLPSENDMGNSEVGHNALGAGRIFSQGAQLVNEAISSGSVTAGSSWAMIRQCAEAGGTIHFIGLVSDGNVHSHIDHLFGLLDQCSANGFKKVRVHALLDGRDVDPKSALNYIKPLEEKLSRLSGNGADYRIASGGGRMITTMDRYNANWSVVERGWKAHVLGEGRFFSSASEAVSTYYSEDPEMTDQYMESFVIVEDDVPVGTIEDGDAVVFFNFRGDRAIEISRAFEEDGFSEFDRVRKPDVFYAGLMQYDGDAEIPANYLIEPPAISKTLGEYLCRAEVSSFAISETQKFGHVTYFWNGNRSGYIDEKFELYEEIPSDKIEFDQRPWMKAAEITDRVLEIIAGANHKFIRLNLANGDMVGHTGFPASIRIAVETVDISLKRILDAVQKAGGITVVTADHGNADCMWKKKNGTITPMVAHTLNPVPFIVKDYSDSNSFTMADIQNPGLANVAATLCVLLGYIPPDDYEPSLLEWKSSTTDS
ncbi:putative 2,3-bisphosphoglycerate-independent phosphoglycerate mutase [Desulfomarina profundi]|uniref:2,3-bisphosphoglycerate-independent phosphoglycerate mutase n=1 Tax=Desulfomarina profundi TaxID=2772557 RepID=A0A8D5JL79_9BACT|nr:2,3-bisphosphoglycerate-independent phosphoglycerate mutase [Desulfomarina profundi]BCL60292.1 putative 2,3-bisphosphoglycerate-independent phosphoglycerate mutase [Desulfomarina profundi]